MRSYVSETRLYSYLVTRPTGRAVRLGIEERLAGEPAPMLTVLDFSDVPLIDFSCADEVVAKLVRRALEGADGLGGRFYFRGIADRHLDPIESALRRQGLAVAAEDADGAPLLLGSVDGLPARAWHALCRLGRARPGTVARRLSVPAPRARSALEELEARRLVLGEGGEFLAFRRALAERGSSDPE